MICSRWMNGWMDVPETFLYLPPKFKNGGEKMSVLPKFSEKFLFPNSLYKESDLTIILVVIFQTPPMILETT